MDGPACADGLAVKNVVAVALLCKGMEPAGLLLKLGGMPWQGGRGKTQCAGIKYNLETPRCTFLLFGSGRAVCTGCKSEKEVKTAMTEFRRRLREAGVEVIEPLEYRITNIVCVADLGWKVSLEKAAMGLGLETVDYNPEVFPGLIHRLQNPPGTVLLFGSGRVVIAGAQTLEDGHRAFQQLREKLVSLGLV